MYTIAFFLVGFVASFVGSIAGGGGLISIPILIFLGIPPQVAIASNKLGGFGASIGNIARFWKSSYVQWKYVLFFSLMGLAGGFIGSNILLEIDQGLLYKIVGYVLLGSVALMLIEKRLGTREEHVSTFRKVIGSILYFLMLIYGGFFGGGAGIVILVILTVCFGFTFLEANATGAIAWFFLSIGALSVFMTNGVVDYSVGIPIFFGTLLGGYAGAHTAIKKGDTWIKGVFIAVSVISAVKLLLF